LVGRPRRIPSSRAGIGTSPSVITAWIRAASPALRVSGPIESRVGLSGKTPSVGHRPTVVLCPNRPVKQAGMRTDPPVSVPSAKPHSPAAVATAEPLEEPPGIRCVLASHGFHGVPRASLTPVAPRANSTVLVLPMGMQPAAFRRWTTVPSGPVR